MASLEGKVALVSGAARGIGRAVCLRLAEEGASVVAADRCAPAEGVPYPMAIQPDLHETARLVNARGAKARCEVVDVRSGSALEAVVRRASEEFGGIDIVVPAAGVMGHSPTHQLSDEGWETVLEVNLGGVFKTVRAVLPQMIERGRGGSIVLISSIAGLRGMPGGAAYTAAKHGVVGLARSLCNELAPHHIRVNSVHPTTVDTDMAHNDTMYRVFRPDLAEPTRDDFAVAAAALNALPVPWVDPTDVANAVAWLASEEARYITGAALPVDAGCIQKFP
jgi:SDR family mycofactocin-dependent oxidoreductase